MKKVLVLLLVLAMALSLAACGAGGDKATSEPSPSASAATADAGKTGGTYNVVWVTCSTESQFWQYQQIGMENAVADMEEQHGVTINFSTVGPATEAETEGYIRAFENAIASKPNAIISATQVPDSTIAVAKEAMDQGIVVNFTNCGLEPVGSTKYADSYNQFYTTSSADVGKLAGKQMLDMLKAANSPLKGYIAMEFSNVNASLQPRMDEFKAYLNANAPDIKVLDTLYNNNDMEAAQADIENEIATYGDELIGIYGANNVSGDGIALAVENAGIKDKVITIGVDSDSTEIAALKAGTLDSIIVQDAYGQGYNSVKNAIETLINGKNPESEQQVAVAPVSVTTQNMTEDKYAALLDPTILKKK